MMDIIKFVIAALFGGGLAWGAMKTEVVNIKEQIKQHASYGERLATIEAKLDILLRQTLKENESNF